MLTEEKPIHGFTGWLTASIVDEKVVKFWGSKIRLNWNWTSFCRIVRIKLALVLQIDAKDKNSSRHDHETGWLSSIWIHAEIIDLTLPILSARIH